MHGRAEGDYHFVSYMYHRFGPQSNSGLTPTLLHSAIWIRLPTPRLQNRLFLTVSRPVGYDDFDARMVEARGQILSLFPPVNRVFAEV